MFILQIVSEPRLMSENFQIRNKSVRIENGEEYSRNKGIRILFISPQPFYEDRGTPIAVRDTLKTLSDLGHLVDVATYPQGSEVAFPGIQLNRTSNPFRFRHVPVGFSLRKVLLDLSLFITVLRLAQQNHYDCVHGVEEGAAIALVFKAFFRWPVIYDMQSSIPEQLSRIIWLGRGPGRWLCLKFERWLVKNADCIIASKGLSQRILSIDHKKKFAESMFSGYDNLTYYGNLVECLDVQKPPSVIYTGNFAPYQDLEHLLEAMTIVKTEIPDVKLLLVGGTEIEMARLSKAIRKQGLEGNVLLFSRQHRYDIPKYLGLADVLVLPRTRGENAPLKLYDYMKSGKPIIATDIPAHRALLSEKTAILVESRAKALANGILRGLRDPGLAQKVAKAALAAAQINEKNTLLEVIVKVYSVTTEGYDEEISERKRYLVK